MPKFKLLQLVRDEEDNKPVTKKDFSDLQKTLTWPPTYTRDIDMVKAQEMKEQRNSILESESLSVPEKLAMLGDADRLFMLHKRKADEKDGQKKVSFVVQTPTARSLADVSKRGVGVPMEISEISSKVTSTQKTKAKAILEGLRRVGDLTWTDKGEIYNPATETIDPASNIPELVRYHLQPNKTNTKTPVGYTKFKKAVEQAEQLNPEPVKKKPKPDPPPTTAPKRTIYSPATPGPKPKAADAFKGQTPKTGKNKGRRRTVYD